jgi:ABC-type uncharacterized transport system permease subunit
MQNIRSFFLKQQTLFVVLTALMLSLIAIGLLLVATNRDPFAAVYYFFRGAFGTAYSTADTITRMIPLSIAGVAFLIGALTGIFNVGIEGQLLLGAMASAIVGWAFNLPAIIHVPLMLLSGALAGGLYALIAAWLKAYRGINEILSTIMLNYRSYLREPSCMPDCSWLSWFQFWLTCCCRKQPLGMRCVRSARIRRPPAITVCQLKKEWCFPFS